MCVWIDVDVHPRVVRMSYSIAFCVSVWESCCVPKDGKVRGVSVDRTLLDILHDDNTICVMKYVGMR